MEETAKVNKVVARFADGRVLKGTTADFFPDKRVFHLTQTPVFREEGTLEVRVSDLKALFFVKAYAGDSEYVERKAFDAEHPIIGRAVEVVFNDGEVLVGTTTSYQGGRPGFFLEPADSASNNERCFVVTAATREVNFI